MFMYHACRWHLSEQRCCHLLFPPRQRCDLVAEPAGGEQGIDDELVGSRQKLRFGRYCVGMNTLIFRPQGHRRWNARVPIQLAKNPLEKSLEKPLEISYTGKTPKMGSLDMSQNQIWISSGFSSDFSSGFLVNWIGTLHCELSFSTKLSVDSMEQLWTEVILELNPSQKWFCSHCNHKKCD